MFMALTQTEIAAHLDLDQSAVSRFFKQADFDWRTATLDEVRFAYIRQLRAQASGHVSSTGADLVSERVLTERVEREMKQLVLAEKKAQLINVAQLEPALMQMVGAWKTELLARDDKIKANLDQLYGINLDVQVLNDFTHAAFRHLARYDASRHIAVVPDSGAD
jgi:hypothetical protein